MMLFIKEKSELLDAVNASKIYFSLHKNKENTTTLDNIFEITKYKFSIPQSVMQLL